jgi:hypothetical protein
MGMGLLQLPDDLEKRRQVWTWDDFVSYTDTQLHTKSGSVTNSDGANGLLTIATGGSANNEAWVATTRKNWLMQSNRPLLYECRLNYTEANTNTCAIFAGFSSAFAAGLLVDTTLVPKTTTMSTVGIWKSTGDTVWRALTQIGTAQTVSTSIESTQLAGVDQILRIEVKVVGSNVEVDFLVGQADTTGGADSAFPVGFQQLREGSSGFQKPIKHRVAYAGAVKMGAGVFVKTGSANVETVTLDYEGVLNLR